MPAAAADAPAAAAAVAAAAAAAAAIGRYTSFIVIYPLVGHLGELLSAPHNLNRAPNYCLGMT